VNLEWLDLSFNNIRAVTGLDSLTKLKDLSLYNNSIDSINGLDSCTALHCLSVGNNSISSLENLMYLRKFKNLRMLNLEGNPVCHDPEYRMFVLAHIRNLKYLDYAMVIESDVIAAKEQYQDELLEIEETESIEDAAAEREAQRQQQSSLLDRANLRAVETLFTNMFKEDTEIAKLKSFPGMSELQEDYRANFNALSEQFKVQGLERLEAREAECKLFQEALDSMRQESQAESISIIEGYNRRKKRVMIALKDKEVVETSDFDQLRKETGSMGELLLDLEVQQVEKTEDLINELENVLTEMKAATLDAQQNWFRGVEAMEDAFFNGMRQLVHDLLEKFQNELLGDDVSDEVKSILLDRDMCMNAVAGSHDIHIGKLLEEEEAMRSKETAKFVFLVEGQREEEYNRNRARGMEIENLLNSNYEEMDEMLAQENLDDDYDD